MTALDDLAKTLTTITLLRRYGSARNASAIQYAVAPAVLATATGATRSTLVAAVTAQVAELARDPVDSRVLTRVIDDAIDAAGRNQSAATPVPESGEELS